MVSAPIKKAPYVAPAFSPDRYQAAVIEAYVSTKDSLLVDATAGSGKSATIREMAANRSPGLNVLCCAFSKAIAEELGPKVRPAECKTIHSLGLSILRSQVWGKVSIEASKSYDLASSMRSQIAAFRPKRGDVKWFAQLLDLARLTLWDGSAAALVELIVQRAVEVPELALEQPYNLAALLTAAIAKMRQDALEGVIDFTDMVWLPVVEGWGAVEYDVAMVDEAQDLNAAQLELVLRVAKRHVFVGDRQQAIYGFAGADCNSMDVISARVGATELPLSVCYRCPSSHIAMASKYSAKIEAAPGAKEGTITSLGRDVAMAAMQPGDLVMSRATAPLVGLCLDLLASRKPARVRGKNLSHGLTKVVREVAKRQDFEFEDFGVHLARWADAAAKKLGDPEHPKVAEKVEALMDQVAAVKTCWLAFDAYSAEGLCGEIESIFSAGDEGHRSDLIDLCTAHRAKGLEADRVWLLDPHKLPLVWKKQTAEQYEQEKNLTLVAFTRSKDFLGLVNLEK